MAATNRTYRGKLVNTYKTGDNYISNGSNLNTNKKRMEVASDLNIRDDYGFSRIAFWQLLYQLSPLNSVPIATTKVLLPKQSFKHILNKQLTQQVPSIMLSTSDY